MTEPVDASQTATPNKPPRKAMFIVFIVVFIDLLGFGVVLPLLPRYADAYLEPLGISNSAKGIVIGVILSSFSAMQFIFAPIWGRISDRVGRRPILIMGLAGSVVSYALFGLVSSSLFPQTGWLPLILILLTRIGAGIFGATISTATAVIADCTPKEKRSHGMALIGAAFGIGFTFGPLIAFAGLEFFQQEHAGPGFLAAGLSLVGLLLAIRLMPETLTRDTSPGAKKSRLDLHNLYSTLKTPTVGVLVLTFFITTFSFANFESTLSLLTKASFGMKDQNNFLVFAYLGFVLMFAQGYLYRKFIKTIDEVVLMRIGLGLIFLGLVGVGIVGYYATALHNLTGNATTYVPIFYLVLALAVTGFAFLNPSLQGLISKRSDAHRQGEVMGVNQSFSALARILGPLIGLPLFTENQLLPYCFAGLMLLLLIVLVRKISKEPAKSHEIVGEVAPPMME
jgi:MFS family permease